jgi:hypothetical protein
MKDSDMETVALKFEMTDGFKQKLEDIFEEHEKKTKAIVDEALRKASENLLETAWIKQTLGRDHWGKRVDLFARMNPKSRQAVLVPEGIYAFGLVESVLLKTLGEREHFPSSQMVRWPNGSELHVFSASTPERLRGQKYDRSYYLQSSNMAVWNLRSATKNPDDMETF